MGDPNDYPDCEPDGLGDLKSIKHTSGMRSPAPQIAWGDEYRGWPAEKRLSYAERLASAMNHAADVLQTERSQLLERLMAQEKRIESLEKMIASHGEVVNRELSAQDAEKQQLYAQIVDLDRALKEAKREMQVLRGTKC